MLRGVGASPAAPWGGGGYVDPLFPVRAGGDSAAADAQAEANLEAAGAPPAVAAQVVRTEEYWLGARTGAGLAGLYEAAALHMAAAPSAGGYARAEADLDLRAPEAGLELAGGEAARGYLARAPGPPTPCGVPAPLWTAAWPGAEAFRGRDPREVALVLLRYEALGARGHHFTRPPARAEAVRRMLGGGPLTDLYATAFNSQSLPAEGGRPPGGGRGPPPFCSPYPDVEAPFGSLGSAFAAELRDGAFLANPVDAPAFTRPAVAALLRDLAAAEEAGRDLRVAAGFVVWADAAPPDFAARLAEDARAALGGLEEAEFPGLRAAGASPFLRAAYVLDTDRFPSVDPLRAAGAAGAPGRAGATSVGVVLTSSRAPPPDRAALAALGGGRAWAAAAEPGRPPAEGGGGEEEEDDDDGARVALAPLGPRHQEALERIAADPGTMGAVGAGKPWPAEKVARFIAYAARERASGGAETHRYHNWAVEVGGALAGVVGVNPHPRPPAGDADLAFVTIFLGPEWRGRGVGAAALREALAAFWRGRPAAPVYADVSPRNRASLGLFAKAGFADLGERPGARGARVRRFRRCPPRTFAEAAPPAYKELLTAAILALLRAAPDFHEVPLPAPPGARERGGPGPCLPTWTGQNRTSLVQDYLDGLAILDKAALARLAAGAPWHPATFVIEDGVSAEFLAAERAGAVPGANAAALWFLKPAHPYVGGGKLTRVGRDPGELYRLASADPDLRASDAKTFVLQAEVPRPLLIGFRGEKRKAVLRVHALFVYCGAGPARFRVYVLPRGFFRLSWRPYAPDDPALEVQVAGYIPPATAAAGRWADAVDDYAEGSALFAETWGQVRAIIAESAEMARPTVATGGRRGYALAGYDLMIDEDRKVWLLEVNAHPGFNVVPAYAAQVAGVFPGGVFRPLSQEPPALDLPGWGGDPPASELAGWERLLDFEAPVRR